MADAQAQFAIKLDDETSSPAKAAASALQDLQRKIDADTKSLRAMKAGMRGLQGASTVSISAFRALKSRIDAKSESIAASTAALVELGGSFRKTARPSREFSTSAEKSRASLSSFLAAAKGGSPALSGLSSRVGDLASGIGAAGLAGAALAAVAAVLALGAAVAYAAVSLARFALGAADAARSEMLLLEAATGSAAAATALGAAIASVSRGVAISKGEVAGYAKSLSKAKFAGAELESALEAVSIAAAVGADQNKLLKDLETAKKLGQSVSKIADDVKAKWGGVAAKQMLSFSTQVSKAKENIGAIFAGVKIEPFLEGMRSVLDLFSQSSSTGRALKAIAETMLNPLFSAIGSGAPAAKDFFRGMVIGALKATLGALTLAASIKKAAQKVDSSIAVDWKLLGMFASGAAVAVLVLGAAVGLVVGALLAAAAAPLAFGMAIGYGIGKGVELAAAAIDAVKGKIAAVVSFFSSISLSEAGAALMKGFADGIKNGAAAVLAAAKGVATGAKDAVKSVLGIASPSKVFESLGAASAAGMAGGLEGGAGDVQAAASGIVEVPKAVAAVGSSGGGVNVEGLVVNVYGVQGADDPDFFSKVVSAVTQALELAGASA